MQVYGSTLVHAPQTMTGPHRSAAQTSSLQANSLQSSALQSSSLAEVDQLDISPAAASISRSLDGAGRNERVAQIRAEILAGKYETDEKLNVAVDRLLGEIG